MSSIAEGILTVKVERTPVSTVSVLVDGHSVRPSLGAELQNSRSQYRIQRFQHSRGFSGFSSRQLGWGLEPVMARPLKLTHTHTHPQGATHSSVVRDETWMRRSLHGWNSDPNAWHRRSLVILGYWPCVNIFIEKIIWFYLP
jgi:hypothetical protein